MDYLTLKKHVSSLQRILKLRPKVVRAYDAPGKSIFIRLKTQEGFSNLCLSLDPPNQGIRVDDKSVEIDKNSLMVRGLNRLVINSSLIGVELAGNEAEGQFDRVVKLHFLLIDDYFGHKSDFYIFCEFTGRISDIFFCDSEFKILDRISRTSNNLVGEKYRLPDSCRLIGFDNADGNRLLEAFASPCESWIDKIGGISPLVTKEILFRSGGVGKLAESYLQSFHEILSEAESSSQCWLYTRLGKVLSISAFELKHLLSEDFSGSSANCEKKLFPDINSGMNFIENEFVRQKRLENEKKRVVSLLSGDLKQKKQLLEEQKRLRVKYEDAEKFQKLGNLITANLYRIKPGSSLLDAEDWTTGERVVIELDPSKTPGANAKKYFNLYKKSKRGVAEVHRRVEVLLHDIKWLEERIWLAENAETESWLELEQNTKVKKCSQKNDNYHKKNKIIIKPEIERGDSKYYVGHNAKQNDLITFQIGKKGDIWFHANDVPGAHVVLKKIEGEVNEDDLLFGARLAAANSFARSSSKVAVDYTEISNVKRIPKGGLGQVSYSCQHTLFVSPL